MASSPNLAAAAPREGFLAWFGEHLGAAAIIMWGAAAMAAAPLSVSFQIIALLVGVAIIGAPHGIFDIDLALWAAPSRGRRTWVASFVLLYLALVALVALGWMVLPKLTLISFLAVAAFHFGCEGEGEDGEGQGAWNRAPSVSRGVAVILGPTALHLAATAPIFAGLAGVSVPMAMLGMSLACGTLTPIWITALVAALWLFAKRRARLKALELCGLVALFAAAPPLFAFTVYFCGVHAVGHTRKMARAAALGGSGRRILSAVRACGRSASDWSLVWAMRRLVPAALVCSLALTVLVYGRGSFADAGGQAVLWTFRCLAALTVPHLVLTPMLESWCCGLAKSSACSLDAHSATMYGGVPMRLCNAVSSRKHGPEPLSLC
jgi:Brp/Blh family beta-carotene 15,15'-monooxygenase